MIIDDAIRSQDKRTVCHLYAADPDCELMDETQWAKANPAIDVFRSRQDIIDKLTSAMRLPASEAKMRNLILNQRVAQSNLFCAPSIWKQNDGPVNLELFKTERVSVGLDLSAKTDLTACVFSAKDPESGQIHQIPYVFVPSVGLEERGRRDRAPYPAWVNGGFMYAIGGNSIEYEQVIDFLKDEIKRQGFRTDIVNFDRWRIKDFQKKCKELGLWDGVEWREVGQGYKDMSPICEDYLANLSDSKIRHGGHPLFNYGIRSTIATSDPAGNIKLDKGKSNTRIDMIVAAVMSHGGLSRGVKKPLDVSAMIG
jgi:phage terminase large subunit-like protein